MTSNLRLFFAWLAISSFLLNGTMQPVQAASGPAMEICSVNATRTDTDTKQNPLHAKDHRACAHCCAASHNPALPTTPMQSSLCARAGEAPNLQVTSTVDANPAGSNFQARAPPLQSSH
ncbi:DUF2946 family protein [Collimonas sp.]|uniref:DUF2946 family protein n=1 Tax=Collimonas sp. TaxID=1963772 RepID=UPI002C4B0BAE|nr:DUF2946 family protein [Collimonas sp.]HWW06411.1 DUF2946 family protein [Collimonas sp.]